MCGTLSLPRRLNFKTSRSASRSLYVRRISDGATPRWVTGRQRSPVVNAMGGPRSRIPPSVRARAQHAAHAVLDQASGVCEVPPRGGWHVPRLDAAVHHLPRGGPVKEPHENTKV
jgi:hypothetical protein